GGRDPPGRGTVDRRLVPRPAQRPRAGAGVGDARPRPGARPRHRRRDDRVSEAGPHRPLAPDDRELARDGGRRPPACPRDLGPTPRRAGGSAVSAIDARRALDLWVQIVRDEELYRAMLDGRHAELAEARQLDASDLAILDQFRARPGTRWNVENIRFRATLQVAGRLRSWMPLTTHRLAGTSEDWL